MMLRGLRFLCTPYSLTLNTMNIGTLCLALYLLFVGLSHWIPALGHPVLLSVLAIIAGIALLAGNIR